MKKITNFLSKDDLEINRKNVPIFQGNIGNNQMKRTLEELVLFKRPVFIQQIKFTIGVAVSPQNLKNSQVRTSRIEIGGLIIIL